VSTAFRHSFGLGATRDIGDSPERVRLVQVVIVSEIHLYREGLAPLLRPDKNVAVVGTTESVDAAIDLARLHAVDIVLLDSAPVPGCCGGVI
jgi:hypothetical protein